MQLRVSCATLLMSMVVLSTAAAQEEADARVVAAINADNVELMAKWLKPDPFRVYSLARCEPNWESHYNCSLLHCAVLAESIKVARLLIKSGADVHAKDIDGRTPLHDAASEETAVLLLKHGADVNAKYNDGRTPLHTAALSGHAEIIALLLKHGADVSAKDNDGNTPLMLAAWGGHTEIVAFLIEHGADVNVKSNDGRTPLSRAMQQGHTQTATLLRKHVFGTK